MIGVYVTVPVACFRKGAAREYLETEIVPPPSTCYGFLLSLIGEQNRRRHLGSRVTCGYVGRSVKSTVLRTLWRLKESNGWQDEAGKWYEFSDSDMKRFRAWIVNRIVLQISRLEIQPTALDSLNWTQYLNEWIDYGRPAPEKVIVKQDVKKKINAWSQSSSEFRPMLGSGANARPDYQELLTNVRVVIWIDSTDEVDQKLVLEERVSIAIANPSSIDRFGGLSLGESSHLVDEVSFIDCIDNTAKAEQVQLFVVRERGRYTLPVWVDHVGSAGTLYATGDLETRPLALPPSFNELPIITSPRTI
jgi:CRISPR-associated protein Cas5/DevS